MTEHELENFERQLRRTKPASPPENFTTRLRAAEPTANAGVESGAAAPSIADFSRRLRLALRWLLPASAVALAVLVAWHERQPFGSGPASGSRTSESAASPLLKADDVQIDQRLVSSFDAVARLPGGEPVRFRCENWMDQVVVSDKASGLMVENSKPRFEVVAMGFETY